MLDHLIEIIFRNVPLAKVGFLLKDLTGSGQMVANYCLTLESISIDLSSEQSIREIFSNNTEFGLFVNLTDLCKSDVCLPGCGIVVYKYPDSVSLELNCQLSEILKLIGNDFVKALMKLAKSIAMDYEIGDYFCGIEPAQDAEMRLFTNDELGPLRIINDGKSC
jgi:hypothetical protein